MNGKCPDWDIIEYRDKWPGCFQDLGGLFFCTLPKGHSGSHHAHGINTCYEIVPRSLDSFHNEEDYGKCESWEACDTKDLNNGVLCAEKFHDPKYTWWCTRLVAHQGPHHAHGAAECFHIWPQQIQRRKTK